MTEQELMEYARRWLESNKRNHDEVRYGRFPLGMVNGWIERAEAAEGKASRYEEALMKYGSHTMNCVHARGDCICGWAEVLFAPALSANLQEEAPNGN